MSTTSRDRLSHYTRLATVAGLGSTAAATTYDFSITAPQSVSITFGSYDSSSLALFNMGTGANQFPLNAFVSGSNGNPGSYFWGFKIPNNFRSNFISGPAGEPIFRLGGSQPVTISQGMTGGSGTFAINNTSGVLFGAPPTGYLGFSIAEKDSSRQDTGTYYNGFLQYTFELTGSSATLTINQWAYNVGDVNSSITMPANGASAVPGFGGIAALACGAAGVRRSRRRVA